MRCAQLNELKGKHLVKRATVGISVNRRPKMRFGIKLLPYVEIYGKIDELESLKAELLNYSIGSTLRKKSLRIQGIENCSVMTRFLNKEKYSWWFECIEMFVEGKHLTRKGIKEILDKRPRIRNQGLRLRDEDILNALS